MDNDYYEDMSSYGDFSTTFFRKAKKQHQCCSCKNNINSNEKYIVVSGKYDNVMYSIKYCNKC